MKRNVMKDAQWKILRLWIVPAMFLAAVSHNSAAQWLALGLLLVWTAWQVLAVLSNRSTDNKRIQKEEESCVQEQETLSKTELFLIRQINHRITEQLRLAYPSVSWLWVKRPSLTELETGGSWRIRLNNAEPYNAGEVSVQDTGAMRITLILESPLSHPVKVLTDEETEEKADLQPKDELDRTDALTWYQDYGGDLLAGMIDDLNTQGYRSLTLNDDGEVLVLAGQKTLAVDKLEWFLPRIAWPEFCTLLKEDGITAKEETDGLVLSW